MIKREDVAAKSGEKFERRLCVRFFADQPSNAASLMQIVSESTAATPVQASYLSVASAGGSEQCWIDVITATLGSKKFSTHVAGLLSIKMC